jgi:hypothetical protein
VRSKMTRPGHLKDLTRRRGLTLPARAILKLSRAATDWRRTKIAAQIIEPWTAR